MSDYGDEYGFNQIEKAYCRILAQFVLERILFAAHASLRHNSVAMKTSRCKKLVLDDNGNDEV